MVGHPQNQNYKNSHKEMYPVAKKPQTYKEQLNSQRNLIEEEIRR